MTRAEARKLKNGVYRIFWKDGGQSVAAIGHLRDGDAWIAPTNWVSIDDTGLHWRMVNHVVLIDASGQAEQKG